MSFVAGTGKTNVDLLYGGMPRIPHEGEEIYAKDFRLDLGGGVPGTLINLARLGVPTVLGTYLGEDLFSSFAKSRLEESGVSPVNLYEGKGIPVNVTSAVVTASDRTFISYSDEVAVTDKVLDAVYRLSCGAKIVQMQYGYLPVYEQLRKEGAVLVFDTGWDDEMDMKKYEDYLRVAHYFTPNTKEALKMTGEDTPQKAAKVLSGWFEHVVVKLDQFGCMGLSDGRQFVVPTILEFTHMDSTGAGDAFLSGFIYGLFHEKPFEECILLGNITGGKCVTETGCLTAHCTRRELHTLMQKYSFFTAHA